MFVRSSTLLLTLSLMAALTAAAEAACVLDSRADRWPGGEIPFFLDPDLDPRQVEHFRTNVDYLEAFTDLRYVEQDRPGLFTAGVRPGDPHKGHGSYWLPGRQGGNRLTINSLGISGILHEMLHGVGFWHEQQRTDRDDHIEIQWRNVKAFYQGNFYKQAQTTPVGDFDFDSIMLYGSCSGARGTVDRGPLAACLAGDPEGAVGLRTDGTLYGGGGRHLSAGDLHGVHHLYANATLVVGGAAITSAADAAALCAGGDDVIVIGDVTVDGPDDVSLPCLRRVVGDLEVAITYAGAAIDAWSLKSVAGTLRAVDVPTLEVLDLRGLEAAYRVELIDAPSLLEVLMSLRAVFGDVRVVNTALAGLDLGALERAMHLRVVGNDDLEWVDLAALHTVARHPLFGFGADTGELRVASNRQLTALAAPALRHVREIAIDGNARLAAIRLPAVTSSVDVSSRTRAALTALPFVDAPAPAQWPVRVSVTANPRLGELDLRALRRVLYPSMDVTHHGDLTIAHNGGPDVTLQLRLDALVSVDGRLRIFRNGGLADLQLPRLDEVGEELLVRGMRALAALATPRLAVSHGPVTLDDLGADAGAFTWKADTLSAVGGALSVHDNAAASYALGALTTIGGALTITDHDALLSVGLPQLEAVAGDVLVEGNPALLGFGLPALRAADAVAAVANASLVWLQAGQPTGADLRAQGNTALRGVSAEATTLGDVELVDNGAPGQPFRVRLDDLAAVSGSLVLQRNGATVDFDHLHPGRDGRLARVDGDLRIDAAGSLALAVEGQHLINAVRAARGIGGAVRLSVGSTP